MRGWSGGGWPLAVDPVAVSDVGLEFAPRHVIDADILAMLSDALALVRLPGAGSGGLGTLTTVDSSRGHRDGRRASGGGCGHAV